MAILLLLSVLNCGLMFAAEPTGVYGRVVNAETNTPVRRAVVLATAAGSVQHVFTSAEGSFQFPSTIAAADYTLVVQRDGYTDGTYRLNKASFETPKEILIRLRPQAVVTGHVTDREGQSLQAARIQAMRIPVRDGMDPQVAAATESNDLGDYRLAGIDAGSYQIRLTYRGGRWSELDPTPLTKASAIHGGSEQPITLILKPGSVTPGIDFAVNPAAPLTVRGKITNDAGTVLQPASLWISGKGGEESSNGQTANGEFTVSDVAPGSYTIAAHTLDSQWFGVASLEVGLVDVAGVNIALKPVPQLEAEVRIEGSNPAAAVPAGAVFFMRTRRVTLVPLEIGKVDASGKFTLPLIPGEYAITFDEALSKIGVRSVMLDDKPVVNQKIQIDDSPGVRKLLVVLKASKP